MSDQMAQDRASLKWAQKVNFYDHGEAAVVEALAAVTDALARRLTDAEQVFDFRAHLQRQREFSERTFGPGTRTSGVIDHIRKELREIEADPSDITEWIDVVILALDGAWRAGYLPDQIIDALRTKQARNEARVWPDWRTVDPDRAIEHVRPAAPTGETEARLREQLTALHTACAAEEQAKREAWDETRAAKAEVSALQSELAEARNAYGYLSRLFTFVAPQCEPLPTLSGVATQVDNYIAGLTQQLAENYDESVKVIRRLEDRVQELEGTLCEFVTLANTVWTRDRNGRQQLDVVDREVSHVYDHLTRGRISYPDTNAQAVISTVEDLQTQDIDEAVKEATNELRAERDAAREALTSLRNECRGMLGAFRRELVEATSLTNVRVLERKVADADAALGQPTEPQPSHLCPECHRDLMLSGHCLACEAKHP